MKKITLFIFLIISIQGLSKDLTTSALMAQDTLEITRNLDSVYAHWSEGQKSDFFEGYTIQLFSGDRSNANKVRAEVVESDLGEARVIYKAPNFKVQVGSFPTLLLAEKERQKWIEKFPDAFVVQTIVPLYPIEIPSASVQDSLVAPADSPE